LGISNTLAAVAAEPDVIGPQTGLTATPVADPSQRAGAGQRVTIESTNLESLLLEKGLITQDDWIRLKAEEERRVFEQTPEMQMAGNPRWYERIRMSGYTQFRISTGPTDGKMSIPQGDSNATTNQREFYFRRIRLVFQGQVSERLAFFLQGAFEGDGQLTSNREIIDAYGDYYLTKDKVHRLRVGMHRVPNSFDTYRSSTNRQELDRHESIQSGAPGERDLGIAYYWSPKVAQERYAQLAAYHNGPGDYGVFGVMVYNGQGRNKAELNGNKHVGVRLAYPFELPNGRLLETGVMAFRGMFSVTGTDSPTNATSAAKCRDAKNVEGGCDINDERITAYLWTPPQPWGLLAEGTIGRNAKRNAGNNTVEESSLRGGYVQGYYTWQYSDVAQLTPYVRFGEYYGGIKATSGAPDGQTRTWNFGLVWEPDTHWRFVTELMLKDGLGTTLVRNQAQNEFDASLLRFQAQFFFN
jgi:phosphate-selective porin